MPIFDVEFAPSALKEWRKLESSIRDQLGRKLESLRHEPRVPSMRLSRWTDCYRIKLRKVGYRLVYKVLGSRMVIVVVSVGRRDKNEAYEVVEDRLGRLDDRN